MSRENDDVTGDEMPLMEAARNGDAKSLSSLLQSRINVNGEQADKGLIASVANGHEKCVELLIKAGADVNTVAGDGEPVLMTAVKRGHDGCVKELIEAGADVKGVVTAVASQGLYSCLESLIKGGVSVNDFRTLENEEDDEDNDDITKEEAEANIIEDYEVVKTNKEDDAKETKNEADSYDLNNEDSSTQDAEREKTRTDGQTDGDINKDNDDEDEKEEEEEEEKEMIFSPALIEASRNGHHSCANLLIKAGADVNGSDESGDTPLSNAAANGHVTCVEVLIEAGAVVDNFYSYERNPLIAAAANGHDRCLKILIESGGDKDCEETGNTPLNNATRSGHTACLEVLIKAGADVNRETYECNEDLAHLDRTAVTDAVWQDQTDCLALLLQAGAKPNSDSVILSSMFGHHECLKLLLDAGANVNELHNTLYEAPLSVAARCGRPKCLDVLICAGADMTLTDAAGKTPLSLAAFYRLDGYGCEGDQPSARDRVNCIKSLLRAGAHVNICPQRDEHNAIEYLIAKSDGWQVAEMFKTKALLLFAAGEQLAERRVWEQWSGDTAYVNILKYLQRLRRPKMFLKDVCRHAVRKHLLEIEPHENLFIRIPKLGLPDIVTKYLLYNMSVDESDEPASDDSEEEDDTDNDSD